MRPVSTLAGLVFALVIAVLVACAGGDTAPQTESPPDEPVGPTIADAMGRFRNQDWAGAAATLAQVIEREPENVRAHMLLGNTRRRQNDLDGALAAYEKASEIDAENRNAVYNQAAVHALRGDADRAFELLGRLKASGEFNLTGISLDDDLASLRDDERYQALLPSPEDFADPFVEDARVIHEWVGEGEGDQFGWIARNTGDIDGDGVADVVTSAPTAGEEQAGRIYVYSGKSGALLWTADGEPGDQLGLGVERAGDVNADGVPDVIAGAPPNNKAIVYSGVDGSILLTIPASQEGESLGRHIQGVGDVDGDGHSDLLAGAPRNDKAGQDAGRVGLYSGKDGALIKDWFGEEAGDRMGETVAGAVVGDTAWLLLGAPDAGAGDRGRVYVHAGLGDEPRFVIDSDEQGAELGAMFISVVGDLDADGTPDVYAADWAHNAKGPQTGQIVVHSGASGEELLKLTGEVQGDGFGIGIADAGDADGDGHDDLIVGAWQHGGAAPSGGKTYLYSGKDGSALRAWTCKVPGDTFGFDTTNLGDVDGDGKIDFLLTSAWSAKNGARSGRMFILAGD